MGPLVGKCGFLSSLPRSPVAGEDNHLGRWHRRDKAALRPAHRL